MTYFCGFQLRMKDDRPETCTAWTYSWPDLPKRKMSTESIRQTWRQPATNTGQVTTSWPASDRLQFSLRCARMLSEKKEKRMKASKRVGPDPHGLVSMARPPPPPSTVPVRLSLEPESNEKRQPTSTESNRKSYGYLEIFLLEDIELLSARVLNC